MHMMYSVCHSQKRRRDIFHQTKKSAEYAAWNAKNDNAFKGPRTVKFYDVCSGISLPL